MVDLHDSLRQTACPYPFSSTVFLLQAATEIYVCHLGGFLLNYSKTVLKIPFEFILKFFYQ